MVEVATAGGANQASTIVRNSTTGSGSGGGGSSGTLPMEECVRTPGENIPMLFMFPRFSTNEERSKSELVIFFELSR